MLNKVARDSTGSHEVFDFDTARHKVRQFGIKGFEGTKKEDAVLNMLIKLGAKVFCSVLYVMFVLWLHALMTVCTIFSN